MNEIENKIKALMGTIEYKENRVKEINDSFEKEEIYSDFMITRELENELDDLEDQLQILLRTWEEILKVLEEKNIS